MFRFHWSSCSYLHSQLVHSLQLQDMVVLHLSHLLFLVVVLVGWYGLFLKCGHDWGSGTSPQPTLTHREWVIHYLECSSIKCIVLFEYLSVPQDSVIEVLVFWKGLPLRYRCVSDAGEMPWKPGCFVIKLDFSCFVHSMQFFLLLFFSGIWGIASWLSWLCYRHYCISVIKLET